MIPILCNWSIIIPFTIVIVTVAQSKINRNISVHFSLYNSLAKNNLYIKIEGNKYFFLSTAKNYMIENQHIIKELCHHRINH